MNSSRNGRSTGLWLVAALVSIASLTPLKQDLSAGSVSVPVAVDSTRVPWDPDTLMGRSGKLRMLLVSSNRNAEMNVLIDLFGDSTAGLPGLYTANDSGPGQRFHLVNLIPFSAKRKGLLGPYRVGYWPAEQGTVHSARYGNPEGFIEVTPGNQDTPISEHFRLRDFLTKDQARVWPKYLVLDETLVDKLELLIDELAAGGLPVSRMSVMSGFRTPQYNRQSVGAGGRSAVSRHQYGDAADVFVDNDGNGHMDDLTGDGRVNTQDARFLAQAVERVERQHPELVGGVGIYPATDAHGPFIHVDVRGVRARW